MTEAEFYDRLIEEIDNNKLIMYQYKDENECYCSVGLVFKICNIEIPEDENGTYISYIYNDAWDEKIPIKESRKFLTLLQQINDNKKSNKDSIKYFINQYRLNQEIKFSDYF